MLTLHTGAMSSTGSIDLTGLSQSLVELVERTAAGAVAVKAAPYRVVSGVTVREDLIAVAHHTLRREDRIPIRTADGTEAEAAILGRDPSIDIAFLKVEGGKFRTLNTADPSSFKPGTIAAVVGLTMDVGPSASLGILGAVGGARRTWRGGTLDHFLRLDVNLYPSQSGAAVVNAEGDLIGLATPGLLRHSAVAVPVKTLNRVADELLKEGRIRHGYLGVGLQQVTIPAHIREKLKGGAQSGLIVLSIEAGSPAEKAALQIGDILVSLDGKLVGEIDELQTALRGDVVGRTVTVMLIRGGEPIERQLTVAERVKRED
jgi:serine protease Do